MFLFFLFFFLFIFLLSVLIDFLGFTYFMFLFNGSFLLLFLNFIDSRRLLNDVLTLLHIFHELCKFFLFFDIISILVKSFLNSFGISFIYFGVKVQIFGEALYRCRVEFVEFALFAYFVYIKVFL